VVILKVAEATANSQDLYLALGTGKHERSCGFIHLFLEFIKELQTELRVRRTR